MSQREIGLDIFIDVNAEYNNLRLQLTRVNKHLRGKKPTADRFFCQPKPSAPEYCKRRQQRTCQRGGAVKWRVHWKGATFLPEFRSTQFLQCHLTHKKTFQMFLLNNDCGRSREQRNIAAPTYWRHSTDAESWSRWREAELVQYCVGPCRIDHRDVAVAGGAGHHPHRTLRGKRRCAGRKGKWSETTSRWREKDGNGGGLTVLSPEISGGTATAQFSCRK